MIQLQSYADNLKTVIENRISELQINEDNVGMHLNKLVDIIYLNIKIKLNFQTLTITRRKKG